jgi:glycosyltransferase involved in cell wall biosynthesis
MSKFLEGWNRTAHEAILVGTPVVGSGQGGMLELLEKSNQKVVTNFSDLDEIVSKILCEERENIDQTLIFVSRLDRNYFKKSWSAVFKNQIA